MKDNQRIKGVVVEEYSDRVLLSTIDGEKQIMRADIRNIVYDLEEQNLTNLGDFYQDKRMYDKAYYYYNKALDVNRNYKKAREGLNYVTTFLQQSDSMAKLKHIQRLNEEQKWGKTPQMASGDTTQQQKVADELGMTIKDIRGMFEVTDVTPLSVSAKSGIKKGDIILGAWGRTVSYMQPDELFDKFLNKTVMDVPLTIARKIKLKLSPGTKGGSAAIGVKFGYDEMEGLKISKIIPNGIAAKSGIKEGDILIEVQGQATRYMDIKEVENIMNSMNGSDIRIKVKRDIVLWRKFK